jgi:hypothetical protein
VDWTHSESFTQAQLMMPETGLGAARFSSQVFAVLGIELRTLCMMGKRPSP